MKNLPHVRGGMSVAAAIISTAMLVSVSVAPAQGLTDVNLDSNPFSAGTTTVSDQTDADSMPDNPNAELPDKVSKSIDDNDTVVSEQYVLTEDGDLKNIETGKTVTDPKLVGTKDTQPDPLAKTDGDSFIPVQVSEVREKIDEVKDSAKENSTNPASARSSEASKSKVRLAALPNSDYGTSWGTYNGTSAFFDANGDMFVQNARGVIDVSEHNGTIDWQAAKQGGVEGAIIRLGYGIGNVDAQAARNISECLRRGIPFGVYWYSYAYNAAFAAEEAESLADTLASFGVKASDIAYPIYYDLEAWTWTGYQHPTEPAVYNDIVDTWYQHMKNRGLSSLGVYSYTSYLYGPLNSSDIHAKTSWVAQYGPTMNYVDWTVRGRGWQYTSQGHVAGVSGSVDLNAFGSTDGSSMGGTAPAINVANMAAVTIPNGEYYINSYPRASASVDIPSASTANSTATQIWQYGTEAAQRFRFTRHSDGSYSIVNVHSGKALDVRYGSAKAGAVVQQYDANDSTAQRWFIRDNGLGYYLQSALGNLVLDLQNGSTANGTSVRLWTPNGTDAQQWLLASAVNVPTNKQVRLASAKDTKYVIDVPGASTANFTALNLYQSNGSVAQRFVFTKVGNGLYEIQNVNSGKNIDVYNGRTVSGAVVQQYQDNDTQAQRWLVRDAGNGNVTLLNSKSNKALDVQYGTMGNGTPLWIYDSNGSEAQQWKIIAESGSNTVIRKTDVYRLYNPWNGDHMLTASATEYDGMKKIGWRDEGVSFRASNESSNGMAPIYRLYNRYSGDHLFTPDQAEATAAKNAGWTDEGVAFYVPTTGGNKPVYRVYNAKASKHHLTPSTEERDSLLKSGWVSEGTAFTAFN
ncbi:RICIN domain-containing protein [Bifidobacterium oedipodis]|uniref:1,4-beta-N-acetylmuramidase n=1 Tax=Bifidobacterium oedipodis TaxID=2675322 RepID=A0A7Y0ES52_9BIFI|nr:RICIN domain-containing protein [Bifidobacterium sp. DSM 109957]NMM94993.1 1,4-beta-N-acetylmuramidase [Bifidobacterium sp. DSM 109957]